MPSRDFAKEVSRIESDYAAARTHVMKPSALCQAELSFKLFRISFNVRKEG